MKTPLMTIFGFCLLFSGCKYSAESQPVEFVNRNAMSNFKNPYLLTVKIEKDGKLLLNKIETGTISDLREFAEKIKAIFADRQRNGVFYKEIIIDADESTQTQDLEKVVECLVNAKAAPIRLIKDD